MLMRMCFTGIVEEYCCHGSATRVSQAPLEDKQMTSLYYASIAYTLVNPDHCLSSYARYSYADQYSMLAHYFKTLPQKMCLLATPCLEGARTRSGPVTHT